MASPSVTYTFSNSTTADASQVNQNFTDLINGMTDGTKDFSISALTCAGNVAFNGNTTIGNASSDDVTITASLASTISIKTTNSYDIGSVTKGLRYLYFGQSGGSNTAKLVAPSLSADVDLTLPSITSTIIGAESAPTTKGDILARTTTGMSRLAVGTNDYALCADSAASTGVAWKVLPIAGGGTGQTSAANAINALLPSQSSNSGKVLTTNGSAASWGSVISSGTYTPTESNRSNLDASTFYSTMYMQIGNIVHVSGFVNPDPSANNATVSTEITVPVTTANFSSSIQAAGVICADASTGNEPGFVTAVSGAQRVRLQWYNTAGTSTTNMRFEFTYQIQ